MRPSIAAIAIGIGAMIAGCAAPLPTTELPPTREVAPAREFPQLRDYRGEFDVRIKSSGLDQSAIAKIAVTAQLDFIVLGDKVAAGSADYGIGGFTSQILFIPGGTFDIDGGEIVAVNVHDTIRPNADAAALVGAIHDQGGLAIAADPARFARASDYALADGFEAFSNATAFAGANALSFKARAIFESTDRFLLGLEAPQPSAIEAYDRMAAGARVTMLAGFGAAPAVDVMGATVGTWNQLVLFYTTHLLATERNIDPLIDAMKHGRAYISFDVLGYVGEFAFFAEHGSERTMMGDEVAMAPGLMLKCELPDTADEIVIFRDGARAGAIENSATFDFAPTGAGAWRVVAMRRGHPWVMSNPIYVR